MTGIDETNESSSEGPDVLVVDDGARLADLFATWLGPDWSVETAADGAAALEKLTDSVEVVLLDRELPDRSGDEIVAELREAGYDARVVVVTAAAPDFDVIEMGFDDYLVEPVSKAELVAVVEELAGQTAYESDIREYYALVSKKVVLESEKASHELAASETYQELLTRIDELEKRVDDTVSGMSSHDDFVDAFRDLDADR